VVVLPSAWGALALWYQLPGGRLVRTLVLVLWSLAFAAAMVSVWRGRSALPVLASAVATVAVLLWWQQLRPTNLGDWSDDVARMTTGSVAGDRLTVRNVRNFNWRSDSDYTQLWETRDYDLEQVRTADMILSYWSGPAIAHMILSFGFADGRQLAFSVEVRNRRGETFSELGGLFREFNLSVIAADERDVIRVRTNVRGEDDYLYRINMPQSDIRALLLAYVQQANDLAMQARFYNTLTSNCTSVVYHMTSRIVGHLPLDYRLLLTGYLPEYVQSVGGLAPGRSLGELRALGRITARAQAADRSTTFSADIRRGVPGSVMPQ
jgi:hypothetical protein